MGLKKGVNNEQGIKSYDRIHQEAKESVKKLKPASKVVKYLIKK